MNFRKYVYYLASIFTLLKGVREWPMVLRIFLNLPAPKEKIIMLRKNGLRFQVRGKMDIWSIKETHLDRFYEKFGVPIQNGLKIVDIGAGIGDYTLFAAAGYSENTVHAYEPFPDSVCFLKENLELNLVAGAKVFTEAVRGQVGTTILDLTSREPLQFLTEAPKISLETLRVPAITLVQVLDRIGKPCDILKMDCEGAEYAILFNAPDEVLHSIHHIVMEYHDNVTTYTSQNLVEFLKIKGFSS